MDKLNFLSIDDIKYKSCFTNFRHYVLLSSILKDYSFDYFKNGILKINFVDDYSFELYEKVFTFTDNYKLVYLCTYFYDDEKDKVIIKFLGKISYYMKG